MNKTYTVYGIRYLKADRIVYIGMTSSPLYDRRKVHRYKAKTGNYDTLLYQFMNTCGIDNFEYTELGKTHDKKQAEFLENKYINEYDTFYNGMNTRSGGYKNYRNTYTTKHFGKEVLCYKYPSMEFVGEFSSISSMANLLNLERSCVQRVLNGKRLSHKGYTFKHKGESK